MRYPNIKNRPEIPGIEIVLDKDTSVEMDDDTAIGLIELITNKISCRKTIRINTRPRILREIMEMIK